MRDGSFDAPKDESYGEVALSTVTIEALESFRQGEIERRKLTEPPRTGLIWCRPDGGHLNYRTEAKHSRASAEGGWHRIANPARIAPHGGNVDVL